MPTQSQQKAAAIAIWTAADLSSTVLSFFLSIATLWNGLRSGGELRPINKNKLQIAGELAKSAGAIVLTALGIAALITAGGTIPVATLIASCIGFATCIYQLIMAINNGEYTPINKNKLKISGAITKALCTAIILSLVTTSLIIPGVAPVLAVIGAAIGFSVLIHQLVISVHKFRKGIAKLKEFEAGPLKEIEILQKLQRTQILTPEQTKKLEDLKAQHAKLKERSNWIKIMDIGTLFGLIVAGGLIAIGLGVTLIFPPAGLAIAATGAVVATVSGMVKLGVFIGNMIKKKQTHRVEQPPIPEASQSPAVRLPSLKTTRKKPNDHIQFFAKCEAAYSEKKPGVKSHFDSQKVEFEQNEDEAHKNRKK